jgi:hypothetical protein
MNLGMNQPATFDEVVVAVAKLSRYDATTSYYKY